jgi:DNA repair photolyase
MENTKTYHGKAIYNPSGKAGEYSYWACNLYNGCTGRCTYCYNRHGRNAKIVGADFPSLKKGLINEEKAFKIFVKEVRQNLDELKKNGLFFNFVSDPGLKETHNLNLQCIEFCLLNFIKVKLLTKQVWWVDEFINNPYYKGIEKEITIGYTLTGHDEEEPGCSPNLERIDGMYKFNNAGFKTFGSFEPIIELESTYEMIERTLNLDCCDLYKIGLLSGKKYNKTELRGFIRAVCMITYEHKKKVYFKDSLLKQAGMRRECLPVHCVDRNFNL